MDAVTYPRKDVQDELAANFVAVQVNTAEPDDAAKRVMRDTRMIWTPTLIFMDHHGIEIRRQIGYIEPEHLLAEFTLARGLIAMLHARFDEALGLFDEVTRRPAAVPSVPEAWYWRGVAGLRGGKTDEFLGSWKELHQRFPDSTWWSRASFKDV